MIYTMKFEKVKGKNTILLAANCVLFVLQIAISALFFGGLIEYYGVNVSVVGALELILSILNIAQGTIFEYLLKLALGIVYIVATVVVVKNIITAISYFIHGVFDKSEKGEEKKENAFCSFFMLLGDTFKYCLIFIALCIMTSVDFKINDSGMTVLIIGFIVYFSVSILMLYFKNFTIETIVYKGISIAVMGTAYILLFFNLNIPSFENLIHGLRATFGGYLGSISAEVIFTAISLIAIPILNIFLQFYVLYYLSDIWGVELYSKSNFARGKTNVIMGLSIAIPVVNVVIAMVFGNLEIVDAYILYNIIKNDVTIMLTSIVLLISFKFVKFEEKRIVINQVKVEKKKENVEVKTEEVTVKETTKESSAEDKVEESIDLTVQLTKYKDLLEKGLITQEEYAETKRKILGI